MAAKDSIQPHTWRWLAWHVVGKHGGAAACQRYLELMRSQWLSADEVLALAQGRLQTQLERAQREVPYWRERVARPELSLFPVLHRELVVKNLDVLRSDNAGRYRYWKIGSSGSSGLVVHVYRDLSTREWSMGCGWRGDSWGGLRPEDRHVTLLASVNNADVRRKASRPSGEFLHNRYVLSAMVLNLERTREVIDKINRINPKVLSGYTSVLLLIARLGAANGLKPPRLRKVIPTAECCSPEESTEMQAYYQVPVLQRYGSHEFGSMAHQCEQGTWHLNNEMLYFEVQRPDGTIGTTGRGKLLVTSLVNLAMPLVRYEMGDVLDLDGPLCACGRGLSTFKEVLGRTIEFVYCPDGTLITNHAFLAKLRGVPARHIQVIQEQPDELRILLVPQTAITEEHKRWIVETFLPLHGGQLKLNIEVVDQVELSPSGKALRIINRLPKPNLVQ